jgi:hypothetical protein
MVWMKKMFKKHAKLNKTSKHQSLIAFILITAIFIACFTLISKAAPAQSLAEFTSVTEQGNATDINAETSLSTEQQFQCNVVYAYIGKGNLSDVTTTNGMQENPLSQYPSAVYFNFTHISNPLKELCDVKVEVYLIEIVSNKGPTEKYLWLEGTNCNSTFSDFNKTQLVIAKHVDELIDRRTLSGQGGHFKFNWIVGTSVIGGCVGSIGKYSSAPSNLGLWSGGKPDTISVNIRILGWITINGDSVSTTANDQKNTNVKRINFQNFNNGFIYNKIVPNDQLSQVDLFNPTVNEALR